jgi:endoglucanase
LHRSRGELREARSARGLSGRRPLFPAPYEHFNADIAGWTRELGLTLVNYTPGTRSAADYTLEGDANFVSSQAIVDSLVRRELEGWYRAGLDRCGPVAAGNPFGIGVPFIWCSNNLLVALATQCELHARMTGDTRYRGLAARQADWLLGRNPWDTTMFTEVGTESPEDVHLMTTKLTGRRIRGGLVDGPVYERIFKSLLGVSIREPDPLAPFQDARAVYHDDLGDYATNEPTMDGTASAILLWSLVNTARAQ